VSRSGSMTGGLLLTIGLFGGVGGAQEIDQKKVCLSCHDYLEAEITGDTTHPPAADGDCTACHNPHVSRFAGLLRERPGRLCVECHTNLAEELTRHVVHAPVEEGRCVACHAPHGGSHDNLLVAPGAELCSSCHAEVADWQSRPMRHSPFRRNECSTCHEAHASSFAHLSKRPGSDNCMTCHVNDAKFQSAHKNYPVVEADCVGCHDPHASTVAGFFRGQLHFPFAEGDCSDCHGAANSENPFQVDPNLCGDCHADQVSQSREAVFSHVSAGGTGCTFCHNPHSGDDTALLNQPPEKLCLSCHDPGGSSSGQEGRYTTHAQGLVTCTICHAPHGSDQPLLLTSDPVTLCNGCHEHQHNASHPMGEAARDPRNGQLMSCLSCHGVHDAPYEKYMHLDGERDLCLTCHTTFAEPRDE
jgi:predicted CXXCH cytochrome family protein